MWMKNPAKYPNNTRIMRLISEYCYSFENMKITFTTSKNRLIQYLLFDFSNAIQKNPSLPPNGLENTYSYGHILKWFQMNSGPSHSQPFHCNENNILEWHRNLLWFCVCVFMVAWLLLSPCALMSLSPFVVRGIFQFIQTWLMQYDVLGRKYVLSSLIVNRITF